MLAVFAKYRSVSGVVTDLRKRVTLTLEVGFTYYVRVKNICVYMEQLHKHHLILNDNLQRESHKPFGLPTSVT